MFCCCRRLHPVQRTTDLHIPSNPFPFYTQTSLSHDGETLDNADQVEINLLYAAAVNGNKSALERALVRCGKTVKVDVVDKFGRTPLMYSCLANHADCAEILIKYGAEVDKKDLLGRTPLIWASDKGNLNCVKLLLSRGSNWKEKDNEGQTALHLCSNHKDAKCSVVLFKYIETGAVDDQDVNKRTALHTAASFGNAEQVRLLIKQQSNVGIPDIEGRTPLHWAAGSKDPQAVQCVQLILDAAPSVINWQDYEGCTALHLAVAGGNADVVATLVSLESCDVNALDNMFRTPLHWAAVLGFSAVVTILMNHKADIASSDSAGATPLHFAATNNFADTVKVFLSYPGFKDEVDLEGRSAFMWAAGSGADQSIELFIDHDMDLLQTDKLGATAMHAAASSGHLSTVQLLLDSGGKTLMSAADLMKRTALSHACETGQVSVIESLLSSGANVHDSKDRDGQSLLHWAAIGGHADVCRILISAGMNVNAHDLARRTALHCAALGGHVNCILVLLENDADCNCQDQYGIASLHLACSKGHMDAVKLLIQYKANVNTMEHTEDRYTPLDYALMGEYFELMQLLMECGAVSITGIQNFAAMRIQSWFKGVRVRRTFLERKKLLMKHEQLRKDFAKKKLVDDGIQKDDIHVIVANSGSANFVDKTL